MSAFSPTQHEALNVRALVHIIPIALNEDGPATMRDIRSRLINQGRIKKSAKIWQFDNAVKRGLPDR